MLDRRRRLVRPSTRRAATIVAVWGVTAALAAGCSGGSDQAAACVDPSTAPPAETRLMPEGLSLDDIGTVTHVTSTQGHLNVQAVTTKPLDEVTVLLQDAVVAAGYRPAGMDNEGFEAEVFFTAGSFAAGQALVRRGRCDDQWDVDIVLVDPAILPSPSASPSAATS